MNVLATGHEIGQTIYPKRTQSKFDIRKRFTVMLELWKLKIQFEFTCDYCRIVSKEAKLLRSV